MRDHNPKKESVVRVLVALTLVTAACGPAPGGPITQSDGGNPIVTEASYYPLAIGNRWEYRVAEDNGQIVTKVRTVIGQQEVSPGHLAWVLESIEGIERTVAVNDYVPGVGVRRFSDESHDLVSNKLLERTTYDPFTLRFPPFEKAPGFTETYVQRRYGANGALVEEKTKVHQWVVVSEDETVTVPAGRFRTVHVRRLNQDGSKTREYWMAKGVGKVKEVGNFVEELVDWHIEE